MTIINPFPLEISRNHFGGWLSGFIDGEGSFTLSCNFQSGRNYRQPAASFSISVRDDDTDVILLIRSYLQIGRIYLDRERGRSHSKVTYKVFSIKECMLLCQHFDQFPLMAKKKRDFEIWKRAVTILDAIGTWDRIGLRPHVDNRKWSEEFLDIFANICEQLSKVREYKRPESLLKIMEDKLA